jgi:hypothetical protein
MLRLISIISCKVVKCKKLILNFAKEFKTHCEEIAAARYDDQNIYEFETERATHDSTDVGSIIYCVLGKNWVTFEARNHFFSLAVSEHLEKLHDF